jgi:hypothetical protein
MVHQHIKQMRMKHDYELKNESIVLYTKKIHKIISSSNVKYDSLEYHNILMYIKKINKINNLLYRNLITIDSFVKIK